jgi:catalase
VANFRLLAQTGPTSRAGQCPPLRGNQTQHGHRESASVTDATKVWPDSRPTVELGEIAVIKALDTKKVENECLFSPTNATSGIPASDFPLINARTEAYAESFGRRTKWVVRQSPDRGTRGTRMDALI